MSSTPRSSQQLQVVAVIDVHVRTSEQATPVTEPASDPDLPVSPGPSLPGSDAGWELVDERITPVHEDPCATAAYRACQDWWWGLVSLLFGRRRTFRMQEATFYAHKHRFAAGLYQSMGRRILRLSFKKKLWHFLGEHLKLFRLAARAAGAKGCPSDPVEVIMRHWSRHTPIPFDLPTRGVAGSWQNMSRLAYRLAFIRKCYGLLGNHLKVFAKARNEAHRGGEPSAIVLHDWSEWEPNLQEDWPMGLQHQPYQGAPTQHRFLTLCPFPLGPPGEVKRAYRSEEEIRRATHGRRLPEELDDDDEEVIELSS